MPPSPASREALDAAYRATTYRAGKLAVRIGEPAPALDLLLADRGLDEWAYLTAHNPGSVALAPEENRARQKRLLARVAGHPVLLGEAVADDAGDWAAEPSVLVLGIRREDALSLAREFGQNAIVCGQRGGAAELVWVRSAEALR